MCLLKSILTAAVDTQGRSVVSACYMLNLFCIAPVTWRILVFLPYHIVCQLSQVIAYLFCCVVLPLIPLKDEPLIMSAIVP